MKKIASWVDDVSVPFFKWVFHEYPDLRLYDARVEEVPAWEEIDGLLLTGGSDISQKYLKQPVPDVGLIKNPDEKRDAWEFEAIPQAMKRKLPILCICRGHQVLNVALGGTLHLDIPNHHEASQKYGNIQQLRFADEVTVRIPGVNSSHHQAIDKLGEGLVVEAWHKEDDTVEQVRLKDYPFALGVQYHPERDPVYLPIFDAFAERVRQGVS